MSERQVSELSPAAEFEFADLTVRFPCDEQSERLGLQLLPTSLLDQTTVRRRGLAGLPYIDAMPTAGDPTAFVIDPLVQLERVGDPYPGAFAQSHTMRNAPIVDAFRFARREVIQEGLRTIIVTSLRDARRQHRVEHRFSWYAGDKAAETSVTFLTATNDLCR